LLSLALLVFFLYRLVLELQVLLSAQPADSPIHTLPSPAQLQAAASPGLPAPAAAAQQPAAPPAAAPLEAVGAAAAGSLRLGTSDAPLSKLIEHADDDAGAASAHALNGEAFNFVTIYRDESTRSSDRMCEGPRCMGQHFFLVEQRRRSSDTLLEFLLKYELRVMEVFSTVLASTSCARLLPGEKAAWCASQHSLGPRARPPPVVLDIGSNSGFYTMLSASLGAQVLAVDPQPHCLQYVRAAASLGGVGDRVHMLTAFASTEEAAALGVTSQVPIRTGCWGMFPHHETVPGEDSHPAVKLEYGQLPGGNESVSVPHVSLARLLLDIAEEARQAGSGDEGVLLAKMDAEGSECAITQSLVRAGVLKAHTVKNFMVEVNKYALQTISDQAEAPLACIDASVAPPMGTAPCFAEMFQHFQDAGYFIMVHEPWVDHIVNVTEFAWQGWRVVNIWFAVSSPS